MPVVAATELRVRYAETDRMGVVYHANYLIWCEVGRTDLMRQLGAVYADIEQRGVALAVAEASMRFHSSARYDDRIRVETTVESVRSRAVTFDYHISHAQSGERLVSARTMLVALDPHGRPVALPPDVRSLLERALD